MRTNMGTKKFKFLSFIIVSVVLTLNNVLINAITKQVKNSPNKIIKAQKSTIPISPIKTPSNPVAPKIPAVKQIITQITPAPTTPVKITTPSTPATVITKAQITPAQIIPDKILATTTNNSKPKLMGAATPTSPLPSDIYQTCSTWSDCTIGEGAWQILSQPPYNMTGFFCDTQILDASTEVNYDNSLAVNNWYSMAWQTFNPTLMPSSNINIGINIGWCQAGFTNPTIFTKNDGPQECNLAFQNEAINNIFIANQFPITLVPDKQFIGSVNLVNDPMIGDNTYDLSCRIPAINPQYFAYVWDPPICFDAGTSYYPASETNLSSLIAERAARISESAPVYFGTAQQCCYGNTGTNSTGAPTCIYNNGVLWSHLAILLSGILPLAKGTTFDSSNPAIFQPGTKLIESVCGPLPLTASSPCNLNLLADIAATMTRQLLTDISNGNNWKVIADDLNNGADINLQDANGLTPFMQVMLLNNANSVLNELNIKMYLSEIAQLQNFNPNLQDNQGLTALMYCFKAADIVNQVNCVQALATYATARALNPNLQDHQGQTALMYAARQPHDPSGFVNDMVQQILTIPGVNVCLADQSGHTALNYAQKNNNSQGALVAEMISVIQIICDAANPDITLAEIQADIAAGNNSGAIMSNYVNSQNGNGTTSLMNAAQSTSPNALAIVQYLLTIPGININLTDNQGHTALWYAQNSLATPAIRLEIIKALDPTFNITAQLIYDISSNYTANTLANITTDLAAGASLTTPDSTGKSALMYAITNPGGTNSTTAQALEIFNIVLAAAVSQNLIQKNSNPQLSNIVAPLTVPILIYTLQNSGLAYIDQNIGMLQSLLQNPNIDVTAVDSTGANLLIHAAYANYTIPSTIGLAYQIVQFLLSVPAVVNNINATDNSGAGAYTWSQSSQSSWATEIQQAIAAAGGTT